ncbi:hypothetical protein Pse7367_0196 [Thalassoporum mexicanum PCC 7367]|nr:hypothetical protein [Pseudanabaena sp. PCC 7367]AFY68513.1 hypothetical protein Pse7367_0196 [Pseudanabaena sp. PCC 7367]
MQQILSRSPQLWLPLLAIAIGYAILGHTLADLFRDRIFDLWQALLIWLGVLTLGTLAIPVGLGGIIAAIAALAIIFVRVGWGLALLAAIVTIVVMWLGLRETDSEDEQAVLAPIHWYEYIGVALMLLLTIALTLSTLHQFAAPLATVLIGLIGGAIVVAGPQIRDLGLPASDRLKLMGMTTGGGFLIGLLHGLITYRFAVLSWLA